MRLKANLPFRSPTEQLLRAPGDLSLQQLTAYSILVTAHKQIAANQPQYLASKLQLQPRPEDQTLPPRNDNPLRIQSHLKISRGGFFCRSAALFNILPPDLRSATDPKIFKSEVKKWVQQNVAPKPG